MNTSGSTPDNRNLDFAISERLAFACQLEGCHQAQGINYRDKIEDSADGAHADLATARDQLQVFAALRLKELQLLSHWPLVRPPRGTEKLRQFQHGHASDQPWVLLGEHHLAVLELPDLPDLLRKDLLGPMELLLAMAGQLGREGGALREAQGLPSSRESSGLPWSLGLVTFLPKLRQLQAPSLSWMRSFFSDLRPQQRHVGVDDRQHAWFKDLKLHSARTLLKEASAPMCRAFLRFGTPHGVRSQLWESAMGLPPLRPQDVDAFGSLCRAVQAQQTLFDVCLCDDVRHVTDSEHFFLFTEMLRPVLLAFSRDWQVPQHTSVELHPSIASMPAAVKSGADSNSTAVQLPLACSTLPVQGLAVLAAPLCYMYEHPAAVYRMFRSLYCRYWCKLHSLLPLGGPSPALPVLVKTYENLLQELVPEVVVHMHGLGLPISAVALPWIYSGFAGHLAIEEVLLLWDRVLGLDSLLPLPLLSVAIVCFRQQVILTCQSTSEVWEVMSDISQLQTLPLIQAVLFQG